MTEVVHSGHATAILADQTANDLAAARETLIGLMATLAELDLEETDDYWHGFAAGVRRGFRSSSLREQI
jgi:hypothetical protein